MRFADLEFLTQTSLSHIRISIACTPVNNFLMNGNIFGEIYIGVRNSVGFFTSCIWSNMSQL